MDNMYLIEIAEKFDEWLEKMSKDYGMDKDDLQEIIENFLKLLRVF